MHLGVKYGQANRWGRAASTADPVALTLYWRVKT